LNNLASLITSRQQILELQTGVGEWKRCSTKNNSNRNRIQKAAWSC